MGLISRVSSRTYRQKHTMLRLLRTTIRFQSNPSEFLVSRPENGIVVWSMNRPKARNAISKNMVTCIENAMQDIKHDTSVRALVIRSEVKGAFCAGADLKERSTMTPEEVGPFVSRLRGFINNIRDLPCATIAAVDGFALGGGLELALACDLIYSSTDAKMGLTETRLAIIPGAGGTQTLSRRVGSAKAKEMIFTARILDGKAAEEVGLVNENVTPSPNGDGAYLRALEVAKEIAPKGPVALRMAKMAVNKGIEVDLATGLAFEQQCYAQVIPTKDRLEGIQAFKEKRDPVFKGERHFR